MSHQIKEKIVEHIKMVNLTTHELRLIEGIWGIKKYKNMLREKLFSTLDESDGNFQNLPQSGLNRIAESFTK